ncbi:MAG TPA: hypothetical protein VNS32_21170 [Flavisolibacter sp.]|nr:hypothetical protein [Flavisolibacter sp.]
MDEYNSGMDPELIRYFKKIMNSFSVLILWLLSMATLGLFFGFGIIYNYVHWYNVLFYVIFLASLGGMVYYLYRTWRG